MVSEYVKEMKRIKSQFEGLDQILSEHEKGGPMGLQHKVNRELCKGLADVCQLLVDLDNQGEKKN